MWDIAKDAPPLRFRGHEAPVQAVAFTANGGQIVSASNDCTLRVWDLPTQRELKRSWAPRVFGRPFGFPAAGRHFSGFDLGTTEWLSVPRLQKISLTLSRDGMHLVCGRSVWDARTLQLEYFVDKGTLWTDFGAWQRAHGRRSVPPSEAFGMIATNSVGGALTDDASRLVYSGNGTACIFDVVAKNLVLEDRVFSNGAGVFALDVSPDGRYAVVAGSGDAAGVGSATGGKGSLSALCLPSAPAVGSGRAVCRTSRERRFGSVGMGDLGGHEPLMALRVMAKATQTARIASCPLIHVGPNLQSDTTTITPPRS